MTSSAMSDDGVYNNAQNGRLVEAEFGSNYAANNSNNNNNNNNTTTTTTTTTTNNNNNNNKNGAARLSRVSMDILPAGFSVVLDSPDVAKDVQTDPESSSVNSSSSSKMNVYDMGNNNNNIVNNSNQGNEPFYDEGNEMPRA